MSEIQRLIDSVENRIGDSERDLGELERVWKQVQENLEAASALAEDLFNNPERSVGEIETICQGIMRLLDVG